MARHKRSDTLSTIKSIGLVPLFHHHDVEIAIKVIGSCLNGGARFIEFTNRGDRAWDVFKKIASHRDRHRPDMILGAGSVSNAAEAAMYVSAGADAIVSPVLDEQTALFCNAKKIPYLPGCGSLTEIHKAHQAGVDICKVFPAGEVGGPGFIKSILAPCPWAELMPTGGVAPTEKNLAEWFGAGAVCVGMGSKLITEELLKDGDFDELAKRVEMTVKTIQSLRAQQ